MSTEKKQSLETNLGQKEMAESVEYIEKLNEVKKRNNKKKNKKRDNNNGENDEESKQKLLKNRNENEWVHLSCALWIAEVKIQKYDTKSEITGKIYLMIRYR